MSVHGPYHSDSQASADAKAAGHTIEAARARQLPAMSKDLLCDALKEARVELGAYDLRIVEWLAHGESSAIMAITGWIERARRQ